MWLDPATQQMLLDGARPHLPGIVVASVGSGLLNVIARNPIDARRKVGRGGRVLSIIVNTPGPQSPEPRSLSPVPNICPTTRVADQPAGGVVTGSAARLPGSRCTYTRLPSCSRCACGSYDSVDASPRDTKLDDIPPRN